MNTKIKILNWHGITWYKTGGHLYAVSVGIKDLELYQEDIDITDWSEYKLLTWLGY